MTAIHFIGKQQDTDGNAVYHLTIDGQAYTYNKATDILTEAATGRTIRRHYLSYSILKAFYQAWDPDAYQAAQQAATVGGIPDDSENPTSPLYCPAKPQGEPMELRPGHVTTVDLSGLIAAAIDSTEAAEKGPWHIPTRPGENTLLAGIRWVRQQEKAAEKHGSR